MHSALLIDEIIQSIFENILNDGKPSLCSIARCCQAWKDPALDRIWRRLPSAIPLLSLLPGFSTENGIIQLAQTMQDEAFTAFHSYATRVRHIVHDHRVLADHTGVPIHLFRQLSSLESAFIKAKAAGEVALYMGLAPRLRVLRLQVGYTKANSTSATVYGMISLLKECSSLERLSVRGRFEACLHVSLSDLTTLRSLSLHLSSLTEQAFMTASTLPLLANFDVHASRLSCDFLSAAIARTCGAPFFPALENLKIRAEPTLVALVLQNMPRERLRSLHVDYTGPSHSSAFDGLFREMATLPLHEFTLEYAIAIDTSEDMLPYTPNKFFTLDHLRPLSKLRLTSLVIDSWLPLDLTDSAIEEMTTWWPLLVRLELGARSALENAEAMWNPRNSLTSLCTLARGCKYLQSLVITLDADMGYLSNLALARLGSHPLETLSISSRSRPDVTSLSVMLSKLFPFLVDATPGFVGEYEDVWAAVQVAVLARYP